MYRYIVVDDEAIIRQGLIKKIEKLGMPVECVGQAANGIEAIKLIDETDPDIIITDMKMPQMDGVDFLNRIGNMYPDKKVIVLSGYHDFKYMNTAIENRAVGYVLKPFSPSEIQRQLIKAIRQIEQERFINSQLTSMKESINVFQRRIQNHRLLNFILQPVDEICVSENDWQEAYQAVKKFILMGIATTHPDLMRRLESLCAQPFGKVVAVPLEDVSLKYSYLIVLLDYEGREIESCAANIAERVVNLDTDDVLYVSISNTCDSILKLHNLFGEYKASLMNVRLSFKRYILRPGACRAIRIHSDEQIRDIFNNMRCHPSTITEQLDAFFDKLVKNNVTFGVFLEECGQIIKLVNQYALQYNVETKDIMSNFFQKYIFEKDIERIKGDISSYVTYIFNSIINLPRSQEYLIEKVKQYINQNYGSKITLDAIASEFFINPSYFSYIFKIKTGENFNDYLTKVRLEKAKELLTQTNISIDDISKEVGYKNVKYFFKIFKKYTCLTPMEYRNRYQARKQQMQKWRVCKR